MLRFLNQYARTIPEELFLLAVVLPFPGERMLDIAVVWNGDETEGERILHPLRAFMQPFEDSIKSKPYIDEQREGSDSPSDGDYSSCRRSGHLERLDASVIDVIAEFASSAPSESSGITMMYWHGPWCSQRTTMHSDFGASGSNTGCIRIGRQTVRARTRFDGSRISSPRSALFERRGLR